MITNDVKACFENHPELNLIPEDKVSIIKKNLAKDHRTEADWTTIKDILGSFNLIICRLDEPDKKIKTTENILTEDDTLISFTNIDTCQNFIRLHNKIYGRNNKYFRLGAISFNDLITIVKDHEMNISIDPPYEDNKTYMRYICSDQRIMAVRAQNRWKYLHNFLDFMKNRK